MYKFFAFISRMKYIDRWSLMRNAVKENVTEHSHSVAVIAHALANIANIYFDEEINANSVAVRALFHESSEVITGDLPTPIKYYNSDINDAYKKMEYIANDKLLTLLPKEMQDIYGDILNARGIEYRYVKYADKICAFIKCIEEQNAGNTEFVRARKTIAVEIEGFENSAVDYFMQNFVAPFSLTLDELS